MKKSLLFIVASLISSYAMAAEYTMYINDGTQIREEKCEDIDTIKSYGDVVTFFEKEKKRSYNAMTTELTFEEIITANDTVFITWGGVSPVIKNPYTQSIMISTDGDHVTVNCATQLKDVVYKLSGSSSNGSFTIETPRKFTLLMDNLNLASKSYNSAIRSFSGSTMNIELRGTNTLRDTILDTCSATLRSKGQIVFAKESMGSLFVHANAKRAIQTGDYLQISGGDITAQSYRGDAIKANDYFVMSNGTLNILGTGMEVSAGYAVISGGKISIDSRMEDSKGIKIAKDTSLPGSKTNGSITILGGTLDIAMHGGGSKGIKAEHDFIMSGGTLTGKVYGGPITEEENGEEDLSYAALIKADRNLTINEGSVKVTLDKSALGSRGLAADTSIIIEGTATVEIEGNAESYVYENDNGKIKEKCGYGLKADAAINIGGSSTVIILGNATAGTAAENAIICARTETDININDKCSVYFKSTTNAPLRAKNIYFNGGVFISETESANSACGTATAGARGGVFFGVGYSTVITTSRVSSTGVILSDAGYTPNTAINISDAAGTSVLTFATSGHSATSKAKYLTFSSPVIAPASDYVYTYGAVAPQGTSFHGYFPNKEKPTGGTSMDFRTPITGSSLIIRR